MYQIIHLLPSPEPQWVLSGPHVTLRYDCIAHCVFLVDIGYVTFLSPTVPSIISISVSATSVLTLYHHKCHFVLLLASGVQSQKPFVPDADQMSKGVMLGWCSLSFPGIHTYCSHTHFVTRYFHKEIFHHHSLLPLSYSAVSFSSCCECYLTHSFPSPLAQSASLSLT